MKRLVAILALFLATASAHGQFSRGAIALDYGSNFFRFAGDGFDETLSVSTLKLSYDYELAHRLSLSAHYGLPIGSGDGDFGVGGIVGGVVNAIFSGLFGLDTGPNDTVESASGNIMGLTAGFSINKTLNLDLKLLGDVSRHNLTVARTVTGETSYTGTRYGLGLGADISLGPTLDLTIQALANAGAGERDGQSYTASGTTLNLGLRIAL